MVYPMNRCGIIVTHNSNIITDTVIQQYISIYIFTQVKHVCEIKSYEPQFRSKLNFESLKREITTTSLQHWNDALHTSSRWRTDAIIKHATDCEIFSKQIKTSQNSVAERWIDSVVDVVISLLSVIADTGEEPSSLHNSKHTKHTHATQVQNTTLYRDGTTHTK